MTISANFPNVQPSLLLDFANAKQLPPSVTFTRATTATYYDGSTTAMAEQNLVYYSQEFDNAVWTQSNTTIVANNTTAPDGTSTADKVVIAANTSYHDAFANGFPRVANQQYTHSIYVKAGTGIPAVYLYSNRDAVGLIAKFDISAGTYIGNAGANGYAAFDSYSITSAGSGWYRITATFTAASNSNSTFTLGISTTTADTVVPIAGNGTDFCYIWGAQLEQRSSATAYTATTTQPITNYIPVLLTAGGGQPRFDHNPTTSESLGLLIEEQRTNVLQYSANLSVSPWTTSSVSVTAATVIAPDGTLSGNKIIPDATNNVHYIRQLAGSSANYTFSCYFKAAEYASVVMLGVGANHGGAFNLSSGTVTATYGSASAAISSVGNGWYRCSISLTVSGTDFYVYVDNAGAYIGNGFNGVYAWGAQLEAASFLTSYIPTSGAAATRAADFASMTGGNFSSWFNNGQGTLFAEQYITSVVSGSPNNQVAASLYRDSNNFIATGQGVGDGGGSGQRSSVWVQDNNSSRFFQFTGNFITVGLTLKNAVAYEANNFAYSANTQTLITDSAGTVPSVNTLGIGHYIVGSYYYANNPIRKIAFYPVRVTNAQLQALTS